MQFRTSEVTMNTKLSVVCATLGAALLGGAGHSCGTDDGTLTQTWTIQGNNHPANCDTAGAVQMRVVVVNSGGVAEGTNFVACNAFTTSFSLRPDNYTATATFLGANGLAVSQTKLVPVFGISADQTTVRTIDFAINDFLPR
jgi:hypothetical protein